MDELKNGLSDGPPELSPLHGQLLPAAVADRHEPFERPARRSRITRDPARGQPCTWRTLVIKVAAVIVQSTRRVLVKLAALALVANLSLHYC